MGWGLEVAGGTGNWRTFASGRIGLRMGMTAFDPTRTVAAIPRITISDIRRARVSAVAEADDLDSESPCCSRSGGRGNSAKPHGFSPVTLKRAEAFAFVADARI